MITIKTLEEIKIMAEGGKILAKIMKELEKKVRPGIITNDLDKLAEELVLRFGAKCSFKGYQAFPVCLCASVNEEIVHAAPSARILKEGDIVSLDLGIAYKGLHTDMAVTLSVGKVGKETKKLIEVTKKSFEVGVKAVKPGNYFGDISRAVQKYVESQGFNVIRELCGHGIGRHLHENPQILNYIEKKDKDRLLEIKEGMVFCIEPMVASGRGEIKKGKDGYSWETADSSLSAHFEHTIAVTETGPRILTKI